MHGCYDRSAHVQDSSKFLPVLAASQRQWALLRNSCGNCLFFSDIHSEAVSHFLKICTDAMIALHTSKTHPSFFLYWRPRRGSGRYLVDRNGKAADFKNKF